MKTPSQEKKLAQALESSNVAAGLVVQLDACWTTINEHRVSWDASQELLRLLAGLYVFFVIPTIAEHDAERRAVNTVLRARVGLGFSWYSCLKFLSGARAKEVLNNHADVVRAIGGSEIMLTFNKILPTLPEVLARIDREVRMRD